jgi:hypothetical protein
LKTIAERRRQFYEACRADGRFPADGMSAAIHEAAHAVVAVVIGLRVLSTTLAIDSDPPRNSYTRLTFSRRSRAVDPVVVNLAGQAAEVMFGKKQGDWRRMTVTDGTSDIELATLAAGFATDTHAEAVALLDHLWAVTLRLVRRRRDTIERVAAALLDRETLQGDEVRELVRRTPVPNLPL